MDWTAFAIGIASGLAAQVVVFMLLWARIRVRLSTSVFRSVITLHNRLDRAGLSNLYPSRADLVRHRGTATLGDYLALAQQQVILVGLWMAQGVEMEGVVGRIEQLLAQRPALWIGIALINPHGKTLESVSQYLDLDPQEARARALASLRKLQQLRDGLDENDKHRLTLKVYDSLPAFAAILIDPELPSGRIQIDVKLYQQPRYNSFALEFKGQGKYMFEILKHSTEQCFFDAHELTSGTLGGCQGARG